MVLAAILIVLHILDGTPVIVNSEQVTSLRFPIADVEKRVFSHHARCLVNLADGKFVTVQEDCLTVQRMIDGK